MAIEFKDIPTLQDWKLATKSGFMCSKSEESKLQVIGELIDKYNHNYEIARHNILMELKDAIVDWAEGKTGTGLLEAMQALEAIVLKKLAALDQWGIRRYLKAVCIGYELQTEEWESLANEDRMKYRGYDSKGLYTKQMDDQLDVNLRCGEMKKAIRLAYDNYQPLVRARGTSVDDESRTLKIFMAPEFYFRGLPGAFDIGIVSHIFDVIRKETQDVRYRDWLFILGTAVCGTDVTEKGAFKGKMADNVALVQKGGYSGADGVHDYYVEKERVSHIDYRRPSGAFPNPGKENLFDPSVKVWKKPGRKAEIGGKQVVVIPPEGSTDFGTIRASKGTSERIVGCIFTMDGISFGLEVCLDHLNGRLMKAPDKGVQIQLVTSAGASLKDKLGNFPNLACMAKGIAFNVDGGGGHHVMVVFHDIGSKNVNEEIANIVPPIPAPTNRTLFPGDGQIKFYNPLPIFWPTVKLEVSKKLGVLHDKLEGAPVAPPPALPKKVSAARHWPPRA